MCPLHIVPGPAAKIVNNDSSFSVVLNGSVLLTDGNIIFLQN